MGLQRQRDLAMRLGEFPVKLNEVIYGGSPVAVDENGELVKATAAALNNVNGDSTNVGYLGIAYTSYSDALNFTKDRVFAVLVGPMLVTFIKQTENDVDATGGTAGIPGDDFPYDTTLTYQSGDKLYIGATGLWTNVQANANDPFYGVVRSVGTDYLEVFLYSGPSASAVDNNP